MKHLNYNPISSVFKEIISLDIEMARRNVTKRLKKPEDYPLARKYCLQNFRINWCSTIMI